MNIVLRKLRGILTPMLASRAGVSFGAGAPPTSILGLLTSPVVVGLVLGALAMLAMIALGGMEVPLGLIAIGPTLVEQREELHTKQKTAGEVLDLAGKDLDFSRKPVLEKLGATDSADATAKFKALTKELEVIGLELSHAELKEAAKSVRDRDEELRRPVDGQPARPFGDDGKKKSWAQRFVESKQFKQSRETRTTIPFDMDDVDMKTLFETGAGFAPEARRSGVLVPGATRPIQVIDLIPSFPITQNAFVYMEETTRTHAAAEKAEGVAYAESTFVWTQKSSPVQKVTDSIPVTDEQLEDEGQMQSLLEQRLAFGTRQKADSQILVGSGTPPALRGINNVVGIQTQAKATDSQIVAFLRALTKIRFTGRANPTGAVFHPNDWLDIMLTQDSEGRFLFGNPFQGPGPTSLFGIPIAQSDAQTENTGLVVDFANFTRIDDRRGVRVLIGFVGDQFKEGKTTIRADLRMAFTVTRPAAVCTITGI